MSSTRNERLLDRLARLELVVVTGKGGVGKSTVAATLGRLLHGAGRRVLLLEVDPRESLYPLLGVEPSGGDPVEVAPGLHLQNLRPASVLDQLVREQLPFGFLARRVLASSAYRHFAATAPGLQEVAVLGHAMRIARGLGQDDAPEVDLVVLDAPASGHCTSLLAAPLLVSRAIQDGPFGRMGAVLAEFIADREACGIVLTTLAEEMPVQEALELVEALAEQVGRRPEVVLANGLYPETGRLEADSAARELWLRRREVNDRQLARLDRGWTGPRVDLPLLALERSPALVRALETWLGPALAREATA